MFLSFIWCSGYLISVTLLYAISKNPKEDIKPWNIFVCAVFWPLLGGYILYILMKDFFK